MSDSPAPQPNLSQDLQGCRKRFQKLVEPHRPDLYRHCRWITGDPWDAEDLVQDTLLRAFSWLSRRYFEVPPMRPWLLRIATNRWIDRCRERHPETLGDGDNMVEKSTRPAVDRVEFGEAAVVLLALPPRERAVVALVDGLGLSAAEAATCVGTSEGGVRAALHRGRERLAAGRAAPLQQAKRRSDVDSKVVDAFCRAFNAADLGALRELLLPHAQAEVIGLVREDDREEIMKGSLAHTVGEAGHPRAEAVILDGEPLIVINYDAESGGRTLLDVVRFVTVDGMVASYRHYYFCPEVIREIGSLLNRAVKTNGYWH